MRGLRLVLFLKLAFLLGADSAVAQRWEIGINGGVSNYTGELSIVPIVSQSRATAGIFTRINVSKVWAIRTNIQYAGIQGNDTLGKGVVNRNLHFRSNVWELSVVGEFHFRPFGDEPLSFVFTPYLFFGLGVATFNPQAKFGDAWTNLQPLGTEGQKLDGGKGYSRVAVTAPIGLGTKYLFRKRWIVGAEIGYRFTSTDYLDDASKSYPDLEKMQEQRGALATYFADPSVSRNQGEPLSSPNKMRGNSHTHDAFLILNVHLAYRFVKARCFHKTY